MPAVSRLAEFFKGQAILLEYLACMLCGFILSNAFLLGQLAPFGVAFTAAGKKERTTDVYKRQASLCGIGNWCSLPPADC